MDNAVIHGFTISSTSNLSGGFAFHAHALAGSNVRDVVIGTFPIVPASDQHVSAASGLMARRVFMRITWPATATEPATASWSMARTAPTPT